jgi:hypothetical protein
MKRIEAIRKLRALGMAASDLMKALESEGNNQAPPTSWSRDAYTTQYELGFICAKLRGLANDLDR